MNLADPGEQSADNAEAAAAVAEVPIRRRKAFSNAGGAGLSVTELSPRDPKAIAEMSKLINALLTSKEYLYEGLQDGNPA